MRPIINDYLKKDITQNQKIMSNTQMDRVS